MCFTVLLGLMLSLAPVYICCCEMWSNEQMLHLCLYLTTYAAADNVDVTVCTCVKGKD